MRAERGMRILAAARLGREMEEVMSWSAMRVRGWQRLAAEGLGTSSSGRSHPVGTTSSASFSVGVI